MANDIRAVVFDLDGTLYRMRWFFRPLMTLFLFPHIFRLPRFIKVRGRFAGIDFGSSEALADKVSSELACLDNGSQSAVRDWISGSFYRAFTRAMHFMRGSRPGIDATIASLKDKGLKLVVYSDYARTSERLSSLGIDPSSFDLLASAEESGALKPCARPLKEIAVRLGVDPKEVVVVGDRDDTDGGAARAAGMKFVRICEKRPCPAGCMDWVGLRSYLEELG